MKRMTYRLYIIIRYLCHGVDIIQKWDVIQDFTDYCQMLDSNNNEESQLKYMLLHMVTGKNIMFQRNVTMNEKSIVVYCSFKFDM
jgi:hypothetical protein